MVALLDGDKKGKQERGKYQKEFGRGPEAVLTLDILVPGVKVIEDVLDEEARTKIRLELGLPADPTKSQIRRFFQECLARDDMPSLGTEFKKRTTLILDGLAQRLSSSD